MDAKKTIKTLNSMLRGELAATETYQQAIDKASCTPPCPGATSVEEPTQEVTQSEPGFLALYRVVAKKRGPATAGAVATHRRDASEISHRMNRLYSKVTGPLP